ncbi:MAG: type II CAAX endopeptidase family protein [Actinomycetaceae bacterium]|nr:type II CAAX endopeptidase family protein [Actinomycetaceae bacterium]
MQTLIKRQPVVAAFVFGIIGLGILRGSGWLFGNPVPPTAKLAVTYVVIIALTVALLFIFGLGKHLNPKVESASNVLASQQTTKAGFMMGWPMLVISILLLTLSVMLSGDIKLSLPSVTTLVLYILFCLGTGIFEELWCRAGVQNLCSMALSPVKAVLVASVFFGLIHLVNLIDSPHMVIGTITQILYAFGIGVYLGYLYMKTGNIYAAGIWHAIFDFFGLAMIVLAPPADPSLPAQDLPLFVAVLQLIIISPLLVIGLRGLKKIEAGK